MCRQRVAAQICRITSIRRQQHAVTSTLHHHVSHFHSLYFLLQEHKLWEESFKVYERGLSLFKWPHVRDLWQTYLSHFVQRYKGTKLERARDLFRQAIDSVSKATLKLCLYTINPMTQNLTLPRTPSPNPSLLLASN